jgi:integrase
VTLRWDAVDFAHGQMHVGRAKNGAPSVHPLSGAELRALRRLKRDQEPPSPFVFTSERGSPFTTAGWRKMVARLGVAAKLGFTATKTTPPRAWSRPRSSNSRRAVSSTLHGCGR